MTNKTTATEAGVEEDIDFNEVEGNHLLRPFEKVKGSDQLRLLASLRKLGVEDDGSVDDLDMELLADFIDFVAEKFAVSQLEFDKFTAGKGGFERALNLAIAYAGELGNGEA